MRGGISNQNCHLTSRRPPLQLRRRLQSRRNRLWPISTCRRNSASAKFTGQVQSRPPSHQKLTPGSEQGSQVLLDRSDVGSEFVRLGDVGVVLRRVVPVSDQADAERLRGRELLRLLNVFHDEFNVLGRTLLSSIGAEVSTPTQRSNEGRWARREDLRRYRIPLLPGSTGISTSRIRM